MDDTAPPLDPGLTREALNLLADRPEFRLPSRGRQAVVLEEALDKLNRFQPLVELRLGQVLAPLMRKGYQHLGYVTPAMFCREELGIGATTAWDWVHLTDGLLQRPLLRQAFLEGRLPKSHTLELLRLGPEEDPAWATRATTPIPELRRQLKGLRETPAHSEHEPVRVRTFDLEVETYALWLAALELARRREGRDLAPAHALEQIVAEYLAGRPAQPGWGSEPSAIPAVGQENPGPGAQFAHQAGAPALFPDPAGPGAPWLDPAGSKDAPAAPPFIALPQSGRTSADAGPAATDDLQAASAQAAPASAPVSQAGPFEPKPELPDLLLQELPRSPRKLTNLARRLLASRDRVELQQGRLLRLFQEGRLYRELGHRSYRAWLQSRGIAPSSAFQCAARDQALFSHPALRQALVQGLLTATKVDLLVRLPRGFNTESWSNYAENHTCRRLEEAVEAARVLATRHPDVWRQRWGTAPEDLESLADFREKAGLPTLEDACDQLILALQQAASAPTSPGAVQTSAQQAGNPPPVQTSVGAEGSPPPVQTSAQQAGTPPPAQAAGSGTRACSSRVVVTASLSAGPGAARQSPRAADTGDAKTPATLRLRLVLPEAVDRLWRQAEAWLGREAAEPLTSEDCLQVLCLTFLAASGREGRQESKVRRQALERAGYRCEAPGCACRTNLHVHHIVRRSQGGSDELSNLCVVCASHHLRHLHGGTMRVEGDSPEDRVWEVGLQDGQPWRLYCDDCRILRAPPLEEA